MSDINWHPESEAEAEMIKHLDPEEREELQALNEVLSNPNFVPQPLDPDEIGYWKRVAANTLALSESVTAPLTKNDTHALQGTQGT